MPVESENVWSLGETTESHKTRISVVVAAGRDHCLFATRDIRYREEVQSDIEFLHLIASICIWDYIAQNLFFSHADVPPSVT
jgi:hypothetical protein